MKNEIKSESRGIKRKVKNTEEEKRKYITKIDEKKKNEMKKKTKADRKNDK